MSKDPKKNNESEADSEVMNLRKELQASLKVIEAKDEELSALQKSLAELNVRLTELEQDFPESAIPITVTGSDKKKEYRLKYNAIRMNGSLVKAEDLKKNPKLVDQLVESGSDILIEKEKKS